MHEKQRTADGEPLVDRGTIENDEDRELPVDETDVGPQPVSKTPPTTRAEDAKDT